jgi:diaminopimelate epimerase
VEQITDSHVLELGPLIENHAVFPERANVAFVQVVARDEVIQRTWERGSGETLACGTGASAACVAGFMTGRTVRRITNHLRGGDLELEWDESNNRVYLTGPAESVFEGTYQWK